MRGYLTFIVYRVLGALTGRLPPHLGYPLTERLGPLLYAISPGTRNAFTANIGHVLGPGADNTQVEKLVRQACVHALKGHYDLFRLGRMSADEIERMVRIEGQEFLDEALASGRGVILISAHISNVDIVGQLPAVSGVPLTGPVERIQPPPLFRYVTGLRCAHGLRLIPADEPMLPLFRALRRGEMIGLPCDRDVADTAREMQFFGAPAFLPDGPVRLALRTGAALVPAFVLRLPDNTLQVQVEPEIVLSRSGDTEADVTDGMSQVVAAMERKIASHPEQWLVSVPVWSTNHEPRALATAGGDG